MGRTLEAVQRVTPLSGALVIPSIFNLCKDCINCDSESRFVGQAYVDTPYCMYNRTQFPRATKCVDYESESAKEDA